MEAENIVQLELERFEAFIKGTQPAITRGGHLESMRKGMGADPVDSQQGNGTSVVQLQGTKLNQ